MMINEAMRPTLIIGASGFLGNRLYEKMKDKYVIGTYTHHCKEKLEFLDTTNVDCVRAILEKYNPKRIIYVSSLTNTDYCEDNQEEAYLVNVLGVENIMKYAKCKIIYFSTDYVFDGCSDHYYETDQTNPVNYYGNTKRKAEELILRSKDNLVIRVTGLYGYSAQNKFLNEFYTNSIVYKETDLWSSNLYIDDIVNNIEQLCCEHGILHLSDGEKISRYDFSKKAVEILGLRCMVMPILVCDSGKKAKRPKCNVLCSNKHRFKIHSSDEGLRLLKKDLII